MALNLPKTTPLPQPAETVDPDSGSTASIARRLILPDTGSSPGDENATVTPVSATDLLNGPPLRELILLAGKDGVGKSCALVSVAWYVETILNPDATFYVIDSENKLCSALRGFGPDAPKNIVYFKVDTMNQATWSLRHILSKYRPGDWLAVESMARLWERAQDLGYMTVSGYTKPEYMEERSKMSGRKAPVTPSPDQLWSVTKGAHDGAFIDQITRLTDLNILMTTTLAKPPKEGSGFMKENADRRALRIELGLDAGIGGAPQLPYQFETLGLLELKAGKVSCRLLRDNLSHLDEGRVEFDVPDRRSWAMAFWENCRG